MTLSEAIAVAKAWVESRERFGLAPSEMDMPEALDVLIPAAKLAEAVERAQSVGWRFRVTAFNYMTLIERCPELNPEDIARLAARAGEETR